MAKPRIDVIEPYRYLPPDNGGQKACHYFCEAMSDSWDLTCISTFNNPPYDHASYTVERAFKDIKSKYFDPRVRSMIMRSIKERKPDGVILNQPFMAPLLLKAVQNAGSRFMIYVHNLEYRRFGEMGKPWSPLLYPLEKWAYQHADALLFISIDEMIAAQQLWDLPKSKCFYAPYGTSLSKPIAEPRERSRLKQGLGLPADEPMFIYYGDLSYGPNLEALGFIIDEILPRLTERAVAYQMIICGGKLPAGHALSYIQNPRVKYMGFVAELEPYILAADMMVNPTLSGGGVKIKVMEALALGATVVSCASGAEGIIREPCGEKLQVVADHDWDAFADQMMAALGSSIDTPDTFYETYAWRHISNRLATELKPVLKNDPLV